MTSLNNQNLLEENEIQLNVNKCIDSFESFRFNAGAGAGKTYALVETIKYILKNKIKNIEKKNQGIICITYTNVAVDEIKNRLGNSDIVSISTIHDQLWKIIKPYQDELVQLHIKKIKSEIELISSELNDRENSRCSNYAELTESEKFLFNEYAFLNREVYRANRLKNAQGFRNAFTSLNENPSFLESLISNVGNFKEILKRLYKRARYEKCISDLPKKIKKRVDYDDSYNSDRLEYMKFSHDTLLEYAYDLFNENPLLRRIVIDRYPYVFIDEYQDSNRIVVEIFKMLFDDARKYKKDWLIGYFGDTAQNIYDDGVGSDIGMLHSDIKNINKVFNRRSHEQIVNLISKIRDDEIIQKPIFDDRNQGLVSFSYSNDNDSSKNVIKNFLVNYKNDLLKDKTINSKKIDCLVLTNKLVAELSEFGGIYTEISNADNIYWNEIKTKLLSHEINKLHPSILLLYRIVKIYCSILDDKATYIDLFGKLSGFICFSEARDFCRSLQSVDNTTLDDFVCNVSNMLSKECYGNIIKKSFLNNISINQKDICKSGNLYTYVKLKIDELMYDNSGGKNQEDGNEKVKSLMEINLDQWQKWVNFIDRNTDDKDIVYHTYHGTKGEEYENVLIIMEHSFGGGWQGRDKFKNFFLKLKSSSTNKEGNNWDENSTLSFENTKNLLYVACSRAIKNLRILYLDDVSTIKEGVQIIFNDVEEWGTIN